MSRVFTVRQPLRITFALGLALTGLTGLARCGPSGGAHAVVTPARSWAANAVYSDPIAVTPPTPGARWVQFRSPALGRKADYLVSLPPGYNPAHRYPVFYLLHGMPGRPMAFIANADIVGHMEALVRRHRMPPMILVYPDGRINGNTQTDSEWANTRAGRYESYVLDVVHDVDERFSTMPDRGARVIAGVSAGAYGALNIALHNLPVFGAVQVWSGYFLQTRTGVFAHATSAALAFNSPLEYVSRLRPALASDHLTVFLYSGRDDQDSVQVAPMAAALRSAGATVGATLVAGGHNWTPWRQHLAQMLMLAGRDVQRLR